MRRQISIVKLGGSLARSERLTAWLDSLAEAAGEVVVVPGGGPFAERVREMQQRWRFDDPTAHHLALLAMEQFGRMLAVLRPGLAPADSPGPGPGGRHALAGENLQGTVVARDR